MVPNLPWMEALRHHRCGEGKTAGFRPSSPAWKAHDQYYAFRHKRSHTIYLRFG